MRSELLKEPVQCLSQLEWVRGCQISILEGLQKLPFQLVTRIRNIQRQHSCTQLSFRIYWDNATKVGSKF